jgi:hypothetical protein
MACRIRNWPPRQVVAEEMAIAVRMAGTVIYANEGSYIEEWLNDMSAACCS